jgi:hypothetical protein
VGSYFDETDEEYIELLAEYERYIKTSPGAYEDFDDWLEIEYGRSKSKTHKKNGKKIIKQRDQI